MTASANRLAELREARGLRRSVVAAQFEVGERTVYRWETGATPVPSSLIPHLAEFFNVSPEYLMGWDRDDAKAAA
jgi:transcriptional regulator with XRE-family HTH domain